MIKDTNAISGLSLAGNIILGARRAADNAGRALKFWDNALIFDDKKALRKRPRVEALLEEIRGQYAEYFPVDTSMLDAHKAIQDICAAVLVAYDCYNTVGMFRAPFAGSPELAPRRLGVNDCGPFETAILNASITYACYKIGDAVYMAGSIENVAEICGQPLPDAERAEVEKIRADALAALEPVREKYGLTFPIARTVEEADALTEKYDISGFSFVLEKIWKTSGVDIL